MSVCHDGMANCPWLIPTVGARDKLGTYLNPLALITPARALQTGLVEISNGTDYHYRLEKVYFSVLYSILWNWDAVTRAAAAANIAW